MNMYVIDRDVQHQSDMKPQADALLLIGTIEHTFIQVLLLYHVHFEDGVYISGRWYHDVLS